MANWALDDQIKHDVAYSKGFENKGKQAYKFLDHDQGAKLY